MVDACAESEFDGFFEVDDRSEGDAFACDAAVVVGEVFEDREDLVGACFEGSHPEFGASCSDFGSADDGFHISVEDDVGGLAGGLGGGLVFPDPSGFGGEVDDALDGSEGEVDVVEGGG